VVQAAVSWGLVFQCDPMGFLDRPSEDLPVLLAILDIADRRLRRAQDEVTNGKRR
jgi:hypothetical protein